MPRYRSLLGVLALSLPCTLLLGGCGAADNSTGEIKVSPEAQKGDESVRKAMEDMMKSKNAPKSKTPAK